MTITPAGYIFFTTLIFTIVLSILVNKRLSKEADSPIGCFICVYVGLIIICVTSLFVTSIVILTSQSYSLIIYPKYESTVVDVHSQWEEQDYTDSDGFTRSQSVEMHTAIVEFYDSENKLLRLSNSVSSASKPKLGENITVAYHDGKLTEFSLRTILILVALTTMMVILGCITTCFVLYAFNKNINRVREFAWDFVFIFVLPAGTFFMLCGMLYALWDHHTNNGDMPIWAQIMVIFFSLFLIPFLINYIRNIFRGLKKK